MTTRAELIADLDKWLARDDQSAGGLQDTMLRIAQSMINREIYPRDREITAQLVCTTRTTALPATYKTLISITIDSNTERDLELMTPERIREDSVWANQSGTASTAYSLEGNSVVLAPEPSVAAPVTLDIVYHAKFATLVSPTDTNWLLAENYDIYLWAILWAAAVSLEDEELEAKYLGLYEKAKTSLRDSEIIAQFSGSALVSTGNRHIV